MICPYRYTPCNGRPLGRGCGCATGRIAVPIDGVQHWHRGRARGVSSFLAESLKPCRRSTACVALAIAFGLGFTAAVWTVGLIVTR